MLHKLHLSGVGPADDLHIEFASRLNVITGDNGLGKSFLLDAAWWVLTRTWSQYPLIPKPGNTKAKISFEIDATKGRKRFSTDYDPAATDWKRIKGRPPSAGLVLYARTDGGFAIWDPHRNYWKEAPSLGISDRARPDAYIFDSGEVWHGKPIKGDPDGRKFCNGLLQDWVDWQNTKSQTYDQLCRALKKLSSDDGTICPGDPIRLPGDTRKYPTLKMPYGDVAIVHASAGMRRIAALAYLLVWAFNEHLIAAEQLGKAPERRIIFLIDELEAHLHPRWQRLILPALLSVVDALSESHGTKVGVQVVVTTHSPLLLVSLESHFDKARDSLWVLDLNEGKVEVQNLAWERRGNAMNWLTSPVFDKTPGISREAEAVITKLDRLGFDMIPSDEDIAQIESEMRATLSELDPLWARWREYRNVITKRQVAI